MKDFTNVIEIDPENANAFFNRGCCYDSMGDLDLAISDYSVALELDLRSGNEEQGKEGKQQELKIEDNVNVGETDRELSKRETNRNNIRQMVPKISNYSSEEHSGNPYLQQKMMEL